MAATKESVKKVFEEVRSRKRNKATEEACNEFLSNLLSGRDADAMLKDEVIQSVLIQLGKQMIDGQIRTVKEKVASGEFTLLIDGILIKLSWSPCSQKDAFSMTWGFNIESGEGGRYDSNTRTYQGFYHE